MRVYETEVITCVFIHTTFLNVQQPCYEISFADLYSILSFLSCPFTQLYSRLPFLRNAVKILLNFCLGVLVGSEHYGEYVIRTWRRLFN